jgi:hypothetical protein
MLLEMKSAHCELAAASEMGRLNSGSSIHKANQAFGQKEIESGALNRCFVP